LARALCEAGLYDADAEDALFHLQATLNRSRNGLLEAVRQSKAAAGSKLLLVVDQFEELFRFHRAGATSQEEAIGFVNLLLCATQQAEQSVYVVLTMRSDFLGECSQFLGLAEAVNDGEFLIPRMTRDQIQEAIEGPIRVRGAAIAPRLLFRLLNDVQDSQDQLPVLQHALMRTWELWRRSQGSVRGQESAPLDLEHYEATGGMQEALSQHADEVFAALPSEPHRTAAARIFKALTERGPDGRGIRRPTRLGQLAAIAEERMKDEGGRMNNTGDKPGSSFIIHPSSLLVKEIVHQVIDAYRVPGVTFLMPPVTSALDDSTVVDISHESLMRVWRRLRGWVEEEAQSARIYRRLHETAALHAEKRAGLYHDPDLQIAQSWREVSAPNAAWAEQYGGGFDQAMAFLETSHKAAERAEEDREAARQRELERARQLAAAQARVARLFKRFAAGLAVVFCLAVALTIWALMLRQEAIGQEQEALRQEAEANRQRQIAEEEGEKTKALELVQLVLSVDTPNVAAHIAKLSEHRHLCDPMLREAYDEAPPKSSGKLHASLALLPDPGQVDYLYGRLLEADAQELPVIRDALIPNKDGLLDRLWAVMEKPEPGKESLRLRAAAALAKYAPDSKRWESKLQVQAVVYLSTLQEKNVRVLANYFRKDGFVNCSGLFPVVVDGVRCPNSLFTHPAAQTFASVSYYLDRPYRQFRAKVGIPALAPQQTDPTAPLTFEVIGNGKSIWKSNPLAKRGDIQDCALSIPGVKQLELRVDNAGASGWAHPVWLEPRLTADQDAQVAVAIVNELVALPAADLTTWKDALRPVRVKLLAPLSVVYRSINRSEQERSLARDLLADYAADQPQVLADLVMDADEKQFAVMYPKFKDCGEQGLSALAGEIEKNLPADLPSSDDSREKLAKRQANAAVALLRMNQPEKVWPLLKHSPDPRVRSNLIQRLSPLGADGKIIVKQLHRETDLAIRRALLLSLGEFSEKDLTPADGRALLPKLKDMYRTAADPGLHAASEWLLRQWKEDAWLKKTNQAWAGDQQQQLARLEGIQQELKKETSNPQHRWYVNGQGQTLVVIPGPVEFWMGSPPSEEGRGGTVSKYDELRHWQRIGRSFAIASKEVTVEQFFRFRKDHPISRPHAPSDDCPVNNVSWYDAAAYCNWLSEQEGIPKEQWCYEANAEGKYDQGMKPAANYLHRTGYRLPTEAEWEFACRAGATTRYSFGESEELLPKYAWYEKNWQGKLRPVGSLKPNDLGLFDMHGNDWEWCQDEYKAYAKGEDGRATEDNEDMADIVNDNWRVLRGGVFNPKGYERSAARGGNNPTARIWWNGLRPVRSLPFSSFDRYAAACAAALAAAGQGKDIPLDDAAKAKLRRQALDWLKTELTDWSKVQPPRLFIARSLWRWQQDAALAGIRDQAALAKLPLEERKTFTQFWAEVAKSAEPANSTERVEFARGVALIVAGQGKDEPLLDDAVKAKLRRQVLDWLKPELAVATDRAVKARIIAAAAPLPSLLEKLVESAPNDGPFQAELARKFSEQGNNPLANAARTKARTLFERQMAGEPKNSALAAELAQLLLDNLGATEPEWIVLKLAETKTDSGTNLTLQDDGSILVDAAPNTEGPSVRWQPGPQPVRAVRIETSTHALATARNIGGTTWAGQDGRTFTTFHFERNGILAYSYDGRLFRNGTWKQEGDKLYFETNNKYREWRALIRGNVIEGDSWNKKGARSKTKIFRSTTSGAPFFNEYRATASIGVSGPGALRGQFVRLDLPGDNSQFPRHSGDKDKKTINLAELQVFHGDQNIALRKKARQSSTIGQSRLAPQNAVDGNTVGNDQGNPYAHTDFENDPWWEVDLGGERAIDRIVIWNRIEPGPYSAVSARMNHFRIRVLDPTRKVVFEQVVDKAPNPSTEIAPQALLAETKTPATGDHRPLIVRLPRNSLKDGPSRYRVSAATRLADLGLEERRQEALKIANVEIRLAVAYALSGRNDKAVEYYRNGLQADPKLGDDRQAQHRYNAACAAALAAAGPGKDEPPLDDAAKSKLRGQALDWLKAELTVWSKLLKSAPPQTRPFIVRILNHWQQDSDLAGIRDQAALDKLPADEKKACSQLWADVAALLKKAETRRVP
jgi:formylglycine-generating enzyme required for sulfatase activity